MTNLLVKYREQEQEREIENTLSDIIEIQTHLAEYIHQQNHPLLRIENNMERATVHIETGRKDLETANSYYVFYKPIIFGGIIGGLTMTPLGILIGLKVGSYITLSGAVVGCCTGYHIQKV
jgi:hypothetical protein